jgi:hypothetical protein
MARMSADVPLRLASLLALVATVAAVAASSAAAAPERAAKLSSAENRWAVPVVNLTKYLAGRVGSVKTLAANPAILQKGSAVQVKFIYVVADIRTCTSKLKKRGNPPTARLVPFQLSVRDACARYVAATHLLAQGIGKATNGELAGATMIRRSTTEFQRGSALLGRAQAQLAALAK